MSVLSKIQETSGINFDGIETVEQAMASYSSKVSSLWDKSRSAIDIQEMNTYEYQAKKLMREWKRYLLSAEAFIDDGSVKLATYQRIAIVLSGISEENRNPEHAELFKAVDAFRKGWTDRNGNERDAMAFSRLSDYENFRFACSLYISAYADMLAQAGIE